MTICCLGHSSHPLPHFLSLLSRHAITLIADVRSQPYSRYAPHFNKRELAPVLRASGVAYHFLGHQLGGKPSDPALLGPDGAPDFARIAASAGFAAGVEALIALATLGPLAILCAEEDPARCHRGQIIAPALIARGVAVAHIRGDGRVEPHVSRPTALRASLLDL